MNPTHAFTIADFGTCSDSVPFGARGLKTKQTLPPPPPPAASPELLAEQKELEKREAELSFQDEKRRRDLQGSASALFAGTRSAKNISQFRGNKQAAASRGGSGTGLRF